MGEVYRADDVELGRAVALKVLPRPAGDRFPGFIPASGSGSIGWAADDKAVLYSTAERTNIWRRSLADGRETRLTNFTDLAILRFALSPDGRTVLLCRGTTLRDAFLISGFN